MLSIFSSFSWDLYAFFGGLALLEWIMNEYNTGLAQRLKRLPAMWETWIQSLVGKIPWRRKWQPTLVFLPGESHGQRSLMGYSPWCRKEFDMTKQLTLRIFKTIRSNILKEYSFVFFPGMFKMQSKY